MGVSETKKMGYFMRNSVMPALWYKDSLLLKRVIWYKRTWRTNTTCYWETHQFTSVGGKGTDQPSLSVLWWVMYWSVVDFTLCSAHAWYGCQPLTQLTRLTSWAIGSRFWMVWLCWHFVCILLHVHAHRVHITRMGRCHWLKFQW